MIDWINRPIESHVAEALTLSINNNNPSPLPLQHRTPPRAFIPSLTPERASLHNSPTQPTTPPQGPPTPMDVTLPGGPYF